MPQPPCAPQRLRRCAAREFGALFSRVTGRHCPSSALHRSPSAAFGEDTWRAVVSTRRQRRLVPISSVNVQACEVPEPVISSQHLSRARMGIHGAFLPSSVRRHDARIHRLRPHCPHGPPGAPRSPQRRTSGRRAHPTLTPTRLAHWYRRLLHPPPFVISVSLARSRGGSPTLTPVTCPPRGRRASIPRCIGRLILATRQAHTMAPDLAIGSVATSAPAPSRSSA